MKGIIHHCIWVLFIVFSPSVTWATHIVGGELTYSCLGNNNYEITLVVFRDCYNGIPFFDDPAYIGIFDANNQLVTELGDLHPDDNVGGQLIIPLTNNDTLNPFLTNPCLTVPPDVCVHTTIYRDTINLPTRPGGYQLAYQRCCRNMTIVNIIDPLDSGATYAVNITEKALNECNSSAKFTDWPPLYICVNEPIVFDQSAIDLDGDSIIYKMCTPLLGATPTDPIPQPPFNPPYSPINWIDPPYDVDNMLNGFTGGTPLQIDINTGLLTGFPNTIGQFVVGICIEEYRDDELISTTRRDFQYNVGLCGVTVSSFFTPEVVCDETLTVTLDNESQNADQFEWYFNDPNNPGFVSFDLNPSYSYSDTGTYTIMLIAEPDNVCVDTFWQEISVQYPSLTADFDFDFVACSDSLTISVTDLSFDTISMPTEWVWTLSQDFQPIATSTDPNPVFYVSSSGFLLLELVVNSGIGCQNTLQKTFEAVLVDEIIEGDEVAICPDGSVFLNPVFSTEYTYQWLPEAGLDNPNSPNPNASPDTTTTYVVQISDAEGFCEIEQSITVNVPERIEVNIPNDTIICSTDFWLTAESQQATEYLWATDSNFDQIISDSTAVLVTPIGENTYYLLVRDSIGCFVQDSLKVTGQGINVATEDLILICEGESTQLMVENLDAEDVLTYLWTPDNLVVMGQNTATPTVEPTVPGTYTFLVEMENQFGCSTIDSVVVGVLDTLPQLDFVAAQQCSGFTVNFNNTSINANFYQWSFGDLNFPDSISTEVNPSYTYPQAGIYQVMLTYISDVSCPDTIVKEIIVNSPQIVPDFTWMLEECGDSALVGFTDLSTNTQSTIIDWQWNVDNGSNSMQQNPNFVFEEQGNYDIVLVITSDDGCVDSISQNVPIDLIEVNLLDSISICSGMPMPLNPDFDPQYDYQWSPTTGLNDATSPNPTANPLVTTTYSVTISDFSMDTCQVIKDIIVMVPPDLDLTTSDDASTCGEAVTLFAQSNGLSNNYVWSLNVDFSNPIGFESEITVEPEMTDTFYVQVTDDFGCSLNEEVVVNNNTILTATVDETICSGDSIQLRVFNRIPSQELTYVWSPAAPILDGMGTDMTLVSLDQNTTFTIDMSNQFGCTSSAEILVNVLENLSNLSLEADPETIIIGQSTQLKATLDSIYNYQWRADSTLSDLTIYNPVASPTETTTYFLNVMNGNGCDADASIEVVVLTPQCAEPYVFFPNAFSPNGDGENETLKLYGSPIEEAYWVIYNRWGEKVFEAFTPEAEWDGTFKGQALSPDVFGFYVRLKCIGGEEYFKKGNITLLR